MEVEHEDKTTKICKTTWRTFGTLAERWQSDGFWFAPQLGRSGARFWLSAVPKTSRVLMFLDSDLWKKRGNNSDSVQHFVWIARWACGWILRDWISTR